MINDPLTKPTEVYVLIRFVWLILMLMEALTWQPPQQQE